jgi:hypothetical protein
MAQEVKLHVKRVRGVVVLKMAVVRWVLRLLSGIHPGREVLIRCREARVGPPPILGVNSCPG